MATKAKRIIKLMHSVSHRKIASFTSADFKAKDAFKDARCQDSVTIANRRVSFASDVPNDWLELILISSKIRLEYEPETLSPHILSPATVISLTIHQSNRSLPSHTTILMTKINFIYNAPVPVLQKRAPSTVQLHISGSIHS